MFYRPHRKEKNADVLTQVFGSAEAVPSQNYHKKVEIKLRELAKELKTKSKALNEVNTNLTRLDTRRENVRAQMSAKEAEVKKLEEKIEKVCQGSTLDESMEVAKTELKVRGVTPLPLLRK